MDLSGARGSSTTGGAWIQRSTAVARKACQVVSLNHRSFIFHQ
jgi:hypothetical protein